MDCRVEDVYESFRAELRAFFLARTAQPASADDLLQEAFLRLARHCATGRGCEHPRAYLYAIAANTLIDHRRTPESRITKGIGIVSREHLRDIPPERDPDLLLPGYRSAIVLARVPREPAAGRAPGKFRQALNMLAAQVEAVRRLSERGYRTHVLGSRTTFLSLPRLGVLPEALPGARARGTFRPGPMHFLRGLRRPLSGRLRLPCAIVSSYRRSRSHVGSRR